MCKFTNVPCPSFNWESLTLDLDLSKWHLPGIYLLLRNSPCLETFTMYMQPIHGWARDFEVGLFNFLLGSLSMVLYTSYEY